MKDIKSFFATTAGKVSFLIVVLIIVVISVSSSHKSPQPEAAQPTAPVVAATDVSNPVASEPVAQTAPAPEQKPVTAAPKKTATVTPAPTPAPTQTQVPTPAPAAQPTPAPAAKDWHIVGTFSGTSDTNTDSFSLKGSKYRFTTTCAPLDASIPTSDVYGLVNSTAGFSSGYEAFENGLQCPSVAHVSYVYAQDPGDWYLEMKPINAKFVVTVEDYY